MSEQYSKVEIVRPKWTGQQWMEMLIQAMFTVALITLVAWWFFATWFPELGLTYWQLALPVFLIRQLFGAAPIGRRLDN